MSEFHLETTDNRTAFSPGEKIRGVAGWHMDKPPKSAQLRLFWYTQGKGNMDSDVAETRDLDASIAVDAKPFEFHVPDGPYSYSGVSISVCWAIELIIKPGNHIKRVDVTISPSGQEIKGQPPNGSDNARGVRSKMMKLFGSRTR